MSESCGDCRFSAPNEGGLPSTLECRCRPPVGFARREVAQWPKVYPSGWCGEYEQRPAVTQTKAPRAKRPAVGEAEQREQG